MGCALTATPAHVVAIQPAGVKRWTLFAEPDQVGSSAGLDIDATPTNAYVQS